MWRTDSSEKTLMLGKIEGRRRKGDRGQDGWMASPTQWTWVWARLRRWTGKPGMLQSMRSQRVRHDWATELPELKTAANEILSFHYIRKVSSWESIPSFVYFSNTQSIISVKNSHYTRGKNYLRFGEYHIILCPTWGLATWNQPIISGTTSKTKMGLYCLFNMQTWLKQPCESHWRNIQ